MKLQRLLKMVCVPNIRTYTCIWSKGALDDEIMMRGGRQDSTAKINDSAQISHTYIHTHTKENDDKKHLQCAVEDSEAKINDLSRASYIYMYACMHTQMPTCIRKTTTKSACSARLKIQKQKSMIRPGSVLLWTGKSLPGCRLRERQVE